MRTKVLAVVLSLLISGGTGFYVNSYAKNIGNTCSAKSASTCTQVKAANGSCTGSDCNGTATSCANGASGCTSSACIKGVSGCTSSACIKGASGCTSSACIKGVSGCTSSACIKGVSGCTSSACANGMSGCTNSTCTKGTSGCAGLNCGNSDCFQILANCKNGSCDQNTINSLLQCLKNGSCGKQSSTGASSSGKTSNASSATSAVNAGSSSSVSSFSEYQNEVISLVNKERASRGLKALTKNNQLTKTATLKSEDMVKQNYFSHTSPTYGSPFDMMKQFGISFRAAGENIAMGQKTPAEVMQSWMNSTGHRANILNSSYTQIGVGIAKNSSGSLIWTQQFIG